MTSAIDTTANGIVGARAGGNLDQVLRQAASETGIDFKYLLQTAKRESSLNPNLEAATSSATGLFQFVEQTWLATLKSDGPALGLANYARQIEQRPDGGFFVRDAARRHEILELRKKPDIAAKLAGALSRNNADYLAQATGREPTGGELYLAHFLGAKGAVDLVAARAVAPTRSAAELFPQAAAANKSIFYTQEGAPRSVEQVHALLISRHDNAGTARFQPQRAENALASHAPPPSAPDQSLARGSEAAFLASHFSGLTTAFVAEPSSPDGVFGALLQPSGQSAAGSFFAPQVKNSSIRTQAAAIVGDVLPSRYGRIESQGRPQADASQPPAAPLFLNEPGLSLDNPSVFDVADKVRDSYSLLDLEGEEVNGAAGKPLDLSLYRKVD